MLGFLHPDKSATNFLGIMCAALGTIVLLAGLLADVYFGKIAKNYDQVEAHIEKIESDLVKDSNGKDDYKYQVTISYEYEGQQYSGTTSDYDNKTMKEGGNVTIYVRPDNPKKVKIKSLIDERPNFAIMIGGFFAGLGCLMIIVTVIIRIVAIKTNTMNKFFKDDIEGYNVKGIEGVSDQFFATNGRIYKNVLQAIVTDCRSDFSVEKHGEHPLRLYLEHRSKSGQISYYTSDPIWEAEAAEFIGVTVPVYYTDNDYFVDYVAAKNIIKAE